MRPSLPANSPLEQRRPVHEIISMLVVWSAAVVMIAALAVAARAQTVPAAGGAAPSSGGAAPAPSGDATAPLIAPTNSFVPGAPQATPNTQPVQPNPSPAANPLRRSNSLQPNPGELNAGRINAGQSAVTGPAAQGNRQNQSGTFNNGPKNVLNRPGTVPRTTVNPTAAPNAAGAPTAPKAGRIPDAPIATTIPTAARAPVAPLAPSASAVSGAAPADPNVRSVFGLNLSQSENGLSIAEAGNGTFAAGLGLKADDEILSFNGRPAGSFNELDAGFIGMQDPDALRTIGIRRNGMVHTLNITPAMMASLRSAGTLSPTAGVNPAVDAATPATSTAAPNLNAGVPNSQGVAFAPRGDGLTISGMHPGTWAQSIGMEIGDRVSSINGLAVNSSADLLTQLQTATASGAEALQIGVTRNGAGQSLNAAVGTSANDRGFLTALDGFIGDLRTTVGQLGPTVTDQLPQLTDKLAMLRLEAMAPAGETAADARIRNDRLTIQMNDLRNEIRRIGLQTTGPAQAKFNILYGRLDGLMRDFAERR